MKQLKFNPEAKVTEYRNGPLYVKNEAKPVEFKPNIAAWLLKAQHEVQPGQFVPVFVEDAPEPKKADKPKKDEKKAEDK